MNILAVFAAMVLVAGVSMVVIISCAERQRERRRRAWDRARGIWDDVQ
jgi:hypothetical protein